MEYPAMDAIVGRTYHRRWPKTFQQQAQEERTPNVDIFFEINAAREAPAAVILLI
jgi:hypothetical protein